MEEKGSMTRMQLVMDFSSCKMIPIKCVNPAADGGGGHTQMRWMRGKESETFLLTRDDLLHLHVISHSPYYYYQFLLLITF